MNGLGLERITTDRAEDLSPSWSPDGKRIAWLRVREDETGIFVSAAQPGDFHRNIASVSPNRIEAVGRHLDWSPTDLISPPADRASEDEPFRIVTIEVATGHKKQLTTPPPGSVGDSNPVYSPDGKYIAFIRGVSSGVDDIFIQSRMEGQPSGSPTTIATSFPFRGLPTAKCCTSRPTVPGDTICGGFRLRAVPRNV